MLWECSWKNKFVTRLKFCAFFLYFKRKGWSWKVKDFLNGKLSWLWNRKRNANSYYYPLYIYMQSYSFYSFLEWQPLCSTSANSVERHWRVDPLWSCRQLWGFPIVLYYTSYFQRLLKTDTKRKARRNINHKLAKYKVGPCNVRSQRARWFSTTDNATCCQGKIFNIDGLMSVTIFITIIASKSTSRAHVSVLPHSVQIFLFWS